LQQITAELSAIGWNCSGIVRLQADLQQDYPQLSRLTAESSAIKWTCSGIVCIHADSQLLLFILTCHVLDYSHDYHSLSFFALQAILEQGGLYAVSQAPFHLHIKGMHRVSHLPVPKMPFTCDMAAQSIKVGGDTVG